MSNIEEFWKPCENRFEELKQFKTEQFKKNEPF